MPDERYSYSSKLAWLIRVCCDRRMTQASLAVAAVLIKHANRDNGLCCPSVATMVAVSGVPRTTVLRALRDLEDAGWVSTEKRSGAQSRYTLTGSADGTGPIHGTSTTDGTGPIRGLLRGRTGSMHGTEPVPSMEPEKERRAKAKGINAHSGRFDEFWKAYPRKESKAKALTIWSKHGLDQMADAILVDLSARAADAQQWTDPKFIPHPTTYLNARRWEDEWPRALPVAPAVGRLPRETNHEAINAASMRRLGLKP